MNKVNHNFSVWAKHQWAINCDEREAYGNTHLTFEEYCKQNTKYLHDEYIKDKDDERNANI